MYIVGLTGGTGAGKSSAAARFESHGIPIVDADKIGHELIAPDGDAFNEIVAAFGEKILSCATIDRGRLGALVFAEPSALETLNTIMQPKIAQSIGKRCAELAELGRPACLVDAALLADGGTLEPWLHDLILVCSPEDSRVERLVANRSMAPDAAWERIRAQVDPESKRTLARWTIENDGSLDELHIQVDDVAKELLSVAGSSDHGAL